MSLLRRLSLWSRRAIYTNPFMSLTAVWSAAALAIPLVALAAIEKPPPFHRDRPLMKYDQTEDAKERLRVMHYEAFEERKKRLMMSK